MQSSPRSVDCLGGVAHRMPTARTPNLTRRAPRPQRLCSVASKNVEYLLGFAVVDEDPPNTQTPHGGLVTMAPRAGFDTEQIREKARKDLLHLLEGVS